jgi:hypothetical protein
MTLYSWAILSSGIGLLDSETLSYIAQNGVLLLGSYFHTALRAEASLISTQTAPGDIRL